MLTCTAHQLSLIQGFGFAQPLRFRTTKPSTLCAAAAAGNAQVWAMRGGWVACITVAMPVLLVLLSHHSVAVNAAVAWMIRDPRLRFRFADQMCVPPDGVILMFVVMFGCFTCLFSGRWSAAVLFQVCGMIIETHVQYIMFAR
jgi:hypothetical protein